jgi:hypothetical protein
MYSEITKYGAVLYFDNSSVFVKTRCPCYTYNELGAKFIQLGVYLYLDKLTAIYFLCFMLTLKYVIFICMYFLYIMVISVLEK